MNPVDPEQYIRDLERRISQTQGAVPQPPSTESELPPDVSPSAPPSTPSRTSAGEQADGRSDTPTFEGTSRQRFRVVADLAKTMPGRFLLALAVMSVIAVAMFFWHYAGKTTVQGNLVMINSGAKDTIDCNNGNVKLDGDNNTYTITGHCRRLEVFGSANHVTVDSADTISVFGDDNVMIYHSGSPTINKTGNNNTVSQRPNRR
ncbi:hypothetical protein A9W99_22965 [Mycobacterium sp. 1164966.3]|uniref:DUF3060 domain-containing protein n=1 Tax=Mycobacterium sp. 1164966.3 TaxID=1856861 RepID=UPI000800DA0B|nr:DUF3060 domain-containing protein [Mycobacterium sp. 1164966.3]OBA78545.1 hypothetical protein A9W99_22965 [Mycobacterium sp. 1164966.3]